MHYRECGSCGVRYPMASAGGVCPRCGGSLQDGCGGSLQNVSVPRE